MPCIRLRRQINPELISHPSLHTCSESAAEHQESHSGKELTAIMLWKRYAVRLKINSLLYKNKQLEFVFIHRVHFVYIFNVLLLIFLLLKLHFYFHQFIPFTTLIICQGRRKAEANRSSLRAKGGNMGINK